MTLALDHQRKCVRQQTAANDPKQMTNASETLTFVVVVEVSLHHLVPYLPCLQLLLSVVACLFHQQFICS